MHIDDFFQQKWSPEERKAWEFLLPYIKLAILIIDGKATNEDTTAIANPDYSNSFKKSMNKLFKDTFGEDCTIPHPEIEE